MVQRPAPDPDPFPPRVDQCARGWGSTGRGLCVLHEPPTPMEYTRRSCSGTPPSWSGRWAEGGIESVVSWRRSRPRRPASRSYLMPRVRGFRVRTGDLPYEREALAQGGTRRPWSNARLQTRTPSRPGSTNVHEGGDLLAGGCAYCTSPRPPWSTPDARAVAPHPRAVCAELGRVHSVVMGECCRSDRPGPKSGDTEPGRPWATPATPSNTDTRHGQPSVLRESAAPPRSPRRPC